MFYSFNPKTCFVRQGTLNRTEHKFLILCE